MSLIPSLSLFPTPAPACSLSRAIFCDWNSIFFFFTGIKSKHCDKLYISEACLTGWEQLPNDVSPEWYYSVRTSGARFLFREHNSRKSDNHLMFCTQNGSLETRFTSFGINYRVINTKLKPLAGSAFGRNIIQRVHFNFPFFVESNKNNFQGAEKKLFTF